MRTIHGLVIGLVAATLFANPAAAQDRAKALAPAAAVHSGRVIRKSSSVVCRKARISSFDPS